MNRIIVNTTIQTCVFSASFVTVRCLVTSGSHKRSHSLGDKEIGRSPPSPAPEQSTFRDRSNTLSEKPALPVIRDKYKDLTGEVEVSGASSCSLARQRADPSALCFRESLCDNSVFPAVAAAGERALRIRVAEVSGKCSGGLFAPTAASLSSESQAKSFLFSY